MNDYINQNAVAGATAMGGGGAGLAMGLTNTFLGYAMYEKQLEDQSKLMQKSAALNYGYNEKAAQNADARTRALYNEFQSPQALMQQYKAAGLSPSVMAAQMGGAGGMTQGAQGGANVGTPSVPSMSPIDFAQVQLLEAQAENIREDTKTKRGDNKRGATEIENLILESKNKWLENEFKAVENMLKQISLAYETDTFNLKIEKLGYEVKNMYNSLRISTIEGQIKEETKEAVINYTNKKVEELAADIWLKKCQAVAAQSRVKLNDALAENFRTAILQRWAEIGINEQNLNQRKAELNAQVEQWAIENKLATSKNIREWVDMFWENYNGSISNTLELMKQIIPFTGKPPAKVGF